MNQFEKDIALTEGKDGKLLAHKVDCPYVREMRRLERPIVTMFDIQNPLPDDVERHSCLEVRE